MTNTIFAHLRKTLRNFRTANAGNIAITFAFATLPIVGMVGFSVDYSHANSVKVAMQAALDSTALLLSKDAATVTNSDLQTKALSYFNALFTRPEATNIAIAATYTASGGSQVVVNGSAKVPTMFLGIIGYNDIVVNGSSTSNWGSSRLRVALVLDNTGSMTSNNKIGALKTASHNLLNMLKNAAQTNGDIQVAIVPFNTYVKVDPTAYVNKTWIDWSFNGSSGGGGDDDKTSGCNGGDGDSKDNPCSPSKSTWNGCFSDRTQSYDVQNTAPTASNTATWFPAVNCSLAQLLPLSYDWTALNNKIDAMVAAGTTNQPIGLVWGWHALTSSDPLNAPTLPSDTQQVIILLTDGLNTQNRWTTNQASIDAREQLVCNNIKAAGITIYTILVMSGNSTVLQNCASDPSKYFVLTSADQIVTTFNTIGTNLSKLRIAK